MPSAAGQTRESAGQGPRAVGPRLARDWGALDRDRRLAAAAAVGLFATMLLPWYQQNAVVSAARAQPLVSRNLNAFAVFSFVEAAVLLVAVAVLVLLYARAEGRDFHLPGGDGAAIFAGGVWTALLLVLRLFDKPGITHNGVAANVGIQWGIFFALAAAGLLAYAGSRIRAARRPGPPVLRGERGRHDPPQHGPHDPPERGGRHDPPQHGPHDPPERGGRHDPPQHGPHDPPERGGRHDPPQHGPHDPPERGGRHDAPQHGPHDPPERGGRHDAPERDGPHDAPQRGRHEPPAGGRYEAQAARPAPREEQQSSPATPRERYAEGEPTIVVSRSERGRFPPAPATPARAARTTAPASAEQLSFEDAPDDDSY